MLWNEICAQTRAEMAEIINSRVKFEVISSPPPSCYHSLYYLLPPFPLKYIVTNTEYFCQLSKLSLFRISIGR